MDDCTADVCSLLNEREKCEKELDKIAETGLPLDLSRGRPSPEQEITQAISVLCLCTKLLRIKSMMKARS